MEPEVTNAQQGADFVLRKLEQVLDDVSTVVCNVTIRPLAVSFIHDEAQSAFVRYYTLLGTDAQPVVKQWIDSQNLDLLHAAVLCIAQTIRLKAAIIRRLHGMGKFNEICVTYADAVSLATGD
jgi:hypothetical protein